MNEYNIPDNLHIVQAKKCLPQSALTDDTVRDSCFTTSITVHVQVREVYQSFQSNDAVTSSTQLSVK